MPATMNPAERVRRALERWVELTKLTQREFAENELKKSQAWLDKVLAGINDVRLADLDVIAKAMRTTAAELVRGEEEIYQLELRPTELRLIERLRQRPDLLDAIAILLDAKLPHKIGKPRKSGSPASDGA